MAISKLANSFTSKGNKFIFHPKQIDNFLNGSSQSIISAHIAPTNACNLHCKYCNQKNRSKGITLGLEKIQNFVSMLQERGLKAVIVTGGGEPTLYPDFNKLVNWLKKDRKLSVALITNGTNDRCGKEAVSVWDNFTWIRASLNFLGDKIIPLKIPQNVKGDMGFSLVYNNQPLSIFKQIADIANKYNAKYVRILPDCCKSPKEIVKEKTIIQHLIDELKHPRFFVQQKIPAPAKLPVCHQSRLRPFLLPDGSVAPCDCFMLNKIANGKLYKTLPPHFNLAPDKSNPASYADYLDRKFSPQFQPLKECNGCGFIENNGLLQHLIDLKKANPSESAEQLFARMGQTPDFTTTHIDFV